MKAAGYFALLAATFDVSIEAVIQSELAFEKLVDTAEKLRRRRQYRARYRRRGRAMARARA